VRSGHCADTANRSFVTRSGHSRPKSAVIHEAGALAASTYYIEIVRSSALRLDT